MSSILPNEVIIDILTWLPVKSLLRFRCVCKSWLALIASPNFINLHLARSIQINKLSFFFISGPNIFNLRSPLNFHSPNPTLKIRFPFHGSSPQSVTEVRGSCNGLLCLSNLSNDIFLVNPGTRSYTQLPKPPGHYLGTRAPDLGFGCSPFTREYKVIHMCAYPTGSTLHLYQSDVKIYTLSTNSWKSIPDIHVRIGVSSGILVNESLHWIAKRGVNASSSSSGLNFIVVIVSFDIENEEFRDIPMPEFDGSNYKLSFLCAFRGRLCLSHYREQNVQVWTMKEYGVKESWTLQFNIREPALFRALNHFQPFGCLRNGKILLERINGKLVMYDPISECDRDLMVIGMEDGFGIGSTNDYVESLVPVTGRTPVNAPGLDPPFAKF